MCYDQAMIETQTFWQTLPRPLIGLAPMKGVTDHPFRHMQKKYGRPALIYTEFVAVEALAIKNRRLLKDLMYDDSQRPIIAQVYGRTPALFRQMAVILCQLGFDGIDINMGCPTRSVAQHGSGAALIKTPDLAQEIIAATKAGVQDWLNGATVRNCRNAPRYVAEQIEAAHAQLDPAYQQRRLVPVSVKTRVGYDAPQVQAWIPRLLEREPAAISLHGRTLRQGYSGLADWDKIGAAVELARGSGIPVLGNGDLHTLAQAQQRIAAYGVDGVLIGRASIGNPFVFRDGGHALADPEVMLALALEHADFYAASLYDHEFYHFAPMRKHLTRYIEHLPATHELRRSFTQVNAPKDVNAAVARWIQDRGDGKPEYWPSTSAANVL